jgi:hypothetical protein
MAMAPHVHEFVRNFGKSGANRVLSNPGANIVYDQPVSMQRFDADSALHSPVTPDNNVSKIAGTHDATLTGEHYINQEADRAENETQQHNLVRNLGRAALGAGLVAGGVALAVTPEGRQAIQNAGATIKQSAQNIGSRVSSFLGGLGIDRGVDPDIIRNSGDVTPPTTAQRYNQADVPVATQEAQVAKGSPVGSLIPGDKGYEDRLLNKIYQQELEARPPALTKEGMERNMERNAVLSTKPVTESEVITSSQTFAPSQTEDIVAQQQRSEATARLLDVAHKRKAGLTFEEIRRGIDPSDPVQLELSGMPKVDALARMRSLADVEPSSGETITGQSANVVQPELFNVSQQTSATVPSTVDKVDSFISGLTQQADPWTGEHTRKAREGRFELPPVQTIKGEIRDPWYTRGARPERNVSPENLKAVNLVAEVFAKTGERISLDEAHAALGGGELSSSLQKAFKPTERVAIGSQTFDPGQYQTGRTMEIGTGEIKGTTAKDLLDRYVEENVSGLTKQGRQGASRETLGAEYVHGVTPEVANPSAVISTAGGRTMRNVSALDKEALAEGRIEYAGFTGQTTGSDPEAAAATYKSATSPQRVNTFNALLGPQSSSQVLHLKTEGGLVPITTNDFQRRVGNQAHAIFANVAQQHAAASGIELPDPHVVTASGHVIENKNPAFIDAANKLINAKGVSESAYPMLAQQFDNALRQSGIHLAASNDPQLSHGALNTLMGLARNTSTAQVGLENFGRLAGRARARGVIRSETSQVPVGMPGPSIQTVSDAMKNLGLGTQLNSY